MSEENNYISGYVNPFVSNKKDYYERVMSGLSNDNESHSLSLKQGSIVRGICLSGEVGGISNTPGNPLFNAPELVAFADGVARWKIQFCIFSNIANVGNQVSWTNFHGYSPWEPGISMDIRNRRISRMPEAYTEVTYPDFPIYFGSLINVELRGNMFYVKNVFGVTSVSSTTTPQPGPITNFEDPKSTNTIPPVGWTGNRGLVMNDKTVGFMNKLRVAVPSNINLHVNSMQRSPSAQARTTITKINLGDDLIALYNDKLIQEVLDAVGVTNKVKPSPPFKKNGPEHKKMTEVYAKQIERGSYISAHLRSNAIDIKVVKWPKDVRQQYIETVIEHALAQGARKAIYEPKPPHVHIGL